MHLVQKSKQVFSILLMVLFCACLLIALAAPAQAAEILPEDTYIAQSRGGVCTLASSTMLVRSTVNAGEIRLSAYAEGVKPAYLTVKTNPVEVENGMSEYLPQLTLKPCLDRGATPTTPSYTEHFAGVDIASATAGYDEAHASNSFDDNELSEWKNDGRLSTAWITYRLSRKAVVSDICLKLTGWRLRSYPLEIYAGIIKAQFSPFAKLPSVSMLKRGFTTCRHYVPMQRGISEAFSVAKQGGALVYRLFQTMSEFHKAFVAKNVLGEPDEMDEYSFLVRALDTLPLCIANTGVASSVFGTILPIILASGVECDPREIFQYRAERGRRYLREFAGVDDDASIDVLRLCLREAIVRCPSRLLPYISCGEQLSMLIRDCVDEIVEALIRNYNGTTCQPFTDMILVFN